ncbi:bifunctional DNA-formamidopyrimidine glycosylase/DNA-(apurinic or apyrimidinic site) lyase [bacterium]|nr:bifunctional DNA-formamidopyrimidine glycosylase/DNA-(apurinic or apyrimidinic site) lyase [bacterium]
MPELPEVETIVRSLRPFVEGQTVKRLELLHPRIYRHSNPDVLRNAVEGREIERLTRRGKYILFHTGKGRGGALVAHLRMSGRLLIGEVPDDHPHLRARFQFDDGNRLHFIDARTFGTLFTNGSDAPDGFRTLGVEPLSSSFTARRMAALFHGRRAGVKVLLLRQDLIAGIGNIYASEALWLARIHPLTPGGQPAFAEIKRLHRELRRVLRRAIEQMGTTFSDYRRPDGEPGEFGNELLVYGRAGQPCPRCNTSIERVFHHGRSSFFCPHCQHPASRG